MITIVIVLILLDRALDIWEFRRSVKRFTIGVNSREIIDMSH